MLVVKHPSGVVSGRIGLTPSKSISNRLQIISALTDGGINIENLSSSTDTSVLQKILSKSGESVIDAHEAGTAFRFLTSFVAIKEGTHVLTGSERMKLRPIGPLVKALQSLGAQIDYKERAGFPPLLIKGKKLEGGRISIDSSLSSQFVSSLMLVGPCMSEGLIIDFEGKVSSRPYIEMTAALMRSCGAEVSLSEMKVEISPCNYTSTSMRVENDWSAASYWYEVAALSNACTLHLHGLNLPSIQGDSVVCDRMQKLGVISSVREDGIEISRSGECVNFFEADFTSCPDLAMTFAAVCVAKNIPARLTGLENLSIKESDRLTAMETELRKLNPDVRKEKSTLVIPQLKVAFPSSVEFATYNDHRLAMSLSPLALIIPEVRIDDKDVVSKSYPEFWKDMESAGFLLRS